MSFKYSAVLQQLKVSKFDETYRVKVFQEDNGRAEIMGVPIELRLHFFQDF